LRLWLDRHSLDDLSHPREQCVALEGLGDVAIGARRAGAGLVEGLEGAGEKEDGHVGELGIGLDRLAQLVAVHARHDRVGQDDVRTHLAGLAESVFPVVHHRYLVVLRREDDAHDLLDGDRVIGEEEGLGHGDLGREDVSES
jgi:hypothetical protein